MAVLAVLAPPLVVFALPAVTLLARNLDYFPDGYRTGMPLYVAALASAVLGGALTLAWRGPLVRWLAALYLLWAPAWFLHALGVGVTRSVVVTGIVVAAWAVAAAFAARAPRRAVLSASGLVAVIVVLGAGVPALTAAQAARAGGDGGERAGQQVDGPAGEPSDLPNVYHLVLDEYQTDFFTSLLDDDLRAALRGFTFYEDTTAVYGRTELSLASMFASDDYDYRISPDEFRDRAFHGPDSTLGVLGDLGYHRVGHLHRTSYVGGDPPLESYVLHDDLDATSGLFGYADLLTSLWLYTNTPEALSRRILPERHYDQLTADALLPDTAPPRSVTSFRALMRRERDLPARGRYTLAHLLLPHFPHVLDEDCSWREGEATGPVRQAACTNALVVEFVSLLRDLGRFDSSVVIVQGDHGAWHELVDGGVRSLQGRGHFDERASRARARPLLLVHVPGAGEHALAVDGRPATLDDVMPTVFDALGIAHPFTGNRGSLLDEPDDDRERFYHFYDKGDATRTVEGPLVRYRVEDGRLVRERDIDVR
jgi:hypothetical protein